MLGVSPARQSKSSPKKQRAKHGREPRRGTMVGWAAQNANCPYEKRHTNPKASAQKDIFPYNHRASKVRDHYLGSCLRGESGVGDRHARTSVAGQRFNLGIELM
jgi:hypothetical protein